MVPIDVMSRCLLLYFFRGFEVPPCVLSKSDPNRQIGLCTLVFGTDAADIAKPTPPPASSSHLTDTPTITTAVVDPASIVRSSSPPSTESTEDAENEFDSIPPPVCPGYQSAADESGATDFPPADLPTDTDEFEIAISHVDDDCHIFGQVLREGTTFICLIHYVSVVVRLNL